MLWAAGLKKKGRFKTTIKTGALAAHKSQPGGPGSPTRLFNCAKPFRSHPRQALLPPSSPSTLCLSHQTHRQQSKACTQTLGGLSSIVLVPSVENLHLAHIISQNTCQGSSLSADWCNASASCLGHLSAVTPRTPAVPFTPGRGEGGEEPQQRPFSKLRPAGSGAFDLERRSSTHIKTAGSGVPVSASSVSSKGGAALACSALCCLVTHPVAWHGSASDVLLISLVG